MMPRRKAYVERDRHGRERVVIERRGSTKLTTSELLKAAEEREQDLIAENDSLRTRLSAAERDSYEGRNLIGEYQRLVHEHQQCRYLRGQLDAQVRETRIVEEQLDDEKNKTEKLHDKVERLDEKIRLLKRSTYESYKEKYEDKWREAEALKRRILKQDAMLRLADARMIDKTNLLLELKRYMRSKGFYVD